MTLNTIKTTLGYLVTRLRKLGLIKLKTPAIEHIYNYLPISDVISTSGQPSEYEFTLIAENGFDTIINLAPHNADNSLDDEPGTVKKLGLNYIHIPVDFKNPTNNDFELFIQAMDKIKNNKTWIHCAANMRVSAFMYRYRRDILGEKDEVAAADMKKIWEPFGVWSTFIEKIS